MFKFKASDIQEEIIDIIFNQSANYKDLIHFELQDLIKLSFLNSRFLKFKNKNNFTTNDSKDKEKNKNEIKKIQIEQNLNQIILELLKFELQELNLWQIENIITNFSFNNELDLKLEDLFTHLEPHILKVIFLFNSYIL